VAGDEERCGSIRISLFNMVVVLVVFRDFRAYMLLWMYGIVGIIAWV